MPLTESAMTRSRPGSPRPGLLKAPTGVAGLDEITGGGLPLGRPTLVCGGAGSGKTLLGIEFIVRGATRFGEPGVILTFEEDAQELATNVASLGFDLARLVAKKKLFIDYVHIDRSEIEESGAYNLDGLFVRLRHAIEAVGARRVLVDSIEALFAGLSGQAVLRAELRRLFRWLKERGITAVVTAERGEGQLTRHGLEEYLSDAVILLDSRVEDEIATRRLRIVKYRGSAHGSNEYPFLINDRGFSVLPITSLRLAHRAPTARLSTGIAGLDEMMGGRGFLRGSTILVSGTAGTGKSSIAAHLVASACARGERALYFSFEESPDQLIRNMRSIGLDLEPWVNRGLLSFVATRPSAYGLETHLLESYRQVEEFRPSVVVLDPVSDMTGMGRHADVHTMLTRLIDHLKGLEVTALLTSLTGGTSSDLDTEVGISSLIDTWIVVHSFETVGERNRGIGIIKSRGMEHSNLVREFRLSSAGISLLDFYRGTDAILTGSAREARLRGAAQEIDRAKTDLEHRRRETEIQIEGLRARLAFEKEQLEAMVEREERARAGPRSPVRRSRAGARKGPTK